MSAQDLRAYNQIVGEDRQQPKPIWYANGFLIHLVLKSIPIGLYTLFPAIAVLFTDIVVNQLIIVFVVIDFWFTKNVVGRQLLGLRWFFGDDANGQQKLMYQCRANDDYVSSISGKLFWLVQFVYCLLPLIGIVATFIISPVLYQVDFIRVADLIAVFVGGITNLYFFFKVSSDASDKKYQLKEKLGTDFVAKIGAASLFSKV